MEISGSYTLYAPHQRVWAYLLDPSVLQSAIPGCEQLEQTSEDQYRVRLNIAVAAVKGSYEGTLRITERHEREHYRIAVEGKGTRGVLRGDGVILLEARGPRTTMVTYQGDAQLGGAIASIGNRLASFAARTLINQFFARVADALAGETAGEVAPATGGEEQATAIAPATQVSRSAPAQEWVPGLPEARPLEAAQPEAVALSPEAQAPAVAAAPPVSAVAPSAFTSPPRAQPAGGVLPPFLTDFVRRAGLSNGTPESEQRIAWGLAITGGALLVALITAVALFATRIRDR